MHLRRARLEDSDMLLKWANDYTVRQNSFNMSEIQQDEHRKWYLSALDNARLDFYILAADNSDIGTVRIFYNNNLAEISYSIACEYRGRGYGKQILILAEKDIEKKKKADCIVAEVKINNAPSCKIFEELGYVKEVVFDDKKGDYIKYSKKLNLTKIAIRVDMNDTVAAGHVMRCLTIADAIRNEGYYVEFISADKEGASFVEAYGYKAIVLESEFDNLDFEIMLLSDYLQNNQIRILIIDSYYVTERYMTMLKKITKLIYIDDLCNFGFPVDMLINYNIYADEDKYKSLYNGHLPKILLGVKYSPLRKSFENVNSLIRDNVNEILITTGGTDQNISYIILNYLLQQKELQDIVFNVISNTKNAKRLNNVRVKYYCNVKDMAAMMSSNDIIVSAGGFTLYEACACGIPTVSFSIADNQRMNTEAFDKIGLIPFAGDFQGDSRNVCNKIYEKILYFKNYKKNRLSFNKSSRKFINGRGAIEIARAIKGV